MPTDWYAATAAVICWAAVWALAVYAVGAACRRIIRRRGEHHGDMG